MNCQKCGAEIRPGTRFCVKCGTPHTMQQTPAANPEEIRNKAAENPAVKNEASPNVEPAPAGTAMNISETQGKRRPNKKKIAIIGAVTVLVLIAIAISIAMVISNNNKQEQYDLAWDFYNKSEYSNAIETMESVKGFKDSEDLLNEWRCDYAEELIGMGSYEAALDYLESASGTEAEDLTDKANCGIYTEEIYEMCEDGKILEAIDKLLDCPYDDPSLDDLLDDLYVYAEFLGTWVASSSEDAFENLETIDAYVCCSDSEQGSFELSVEGVNEKGNTFKCIAANDSGENSFSYEKEVEEKVKKTAFPSDKKDYSAHKLRADLSSDHYGVLLSGGYVNGIISIPEEYGGSSKEPEDEYETINVTYTYTWYVDDGGNDDPDDDKLICEERKDGDEISDSWVYKRKSDEKK